MYYARTAEAAWMEASGQFPVLLLTGPRQVGKTTLLLRVKEEDRRYVTLDDPALRTLATEDPALFPQRFGHLSSLTRFSTRRSCCRSSRWRWTASGRRADSGLRSRSSSE